MEQLKKYTIRLVMAFWRKCIKMRLLLSGKRWDFVEVEQPIAVHYRDEIVGNYVADIVVDGKVILEIKAVKELSEIHEVQLVNYLKATGIEVGLLINFGRPVTVKRHVMDKK